jgi:type IV pilus assembly protein PilB
MVAARASENRIRLTNLSGTFSRTPARRATNHFTSARRVADLGSQDFCVVIPTREPMKTSTPTPTPRGLRRPKLLGEQLVVAGAITEAQLEQALAFARQRQLKIGQALVELGFLDECGIADALRLQGKLLHVRLTRDIVDDAKARLLAEKSARRLGAVVVNEIAGVLTVALADPTDLGLIDELSALLKKPLLPLHADPESIKKVLDEVFGAVTHVGALEEVAERLDGHGVDFATNLAPLPDAGDESGDPSLDRPVANLVRTLVREAYEVGASDIHLEPRRDRFVVRFRVDGALTDRLSLERVWARPTIARIKILARLDLAQNRLPQDGRAQADLDGRMLDLRIATSPTLHGEGAVIRLLDGGREIATLDQLGLDEVQKDHVLRMIESGDGFVLATGPTGSGKTTTLYALLQKLNSPDLKIVTLEDPVENQVEGVTQISMHEKIGLNFARGLRSVLRQDPDVVLLGEIRDQETAQIAVQAALTGHLVLSTLHTVGTAETITRLEDMGIESYLLADTLRGILAQRLLRRICPDCKTEAKPDARALSRLGIEQGSIALFHGTGCEKCGFTGYRGRVAIREILLITPDLGRAVARREGVAAIREIAAGSGMTTLREDAIRKVAAGVTSLAEAIAATSRG